MISALLYEAAAVLETRGWTKNTRSTEDAQVCLQGALAEANRRLHPPTAVHRMAVALVESYLAAHIVPGARVYNLRIPDWNDEPGRTLDDALLALKTVATEQEARGR
jgi:hypothetical protein